MNEYPFNLADVVAYFDSIQSWYPCGLPEESIQVERTIGGGSGASGLCFLGALKEPRENWKLLESAISKGMKLSVGEVYFVDISQSKGDSIEFASDLQSELHAVGIHHLVVLGDEGRNAIELKGDLGSWQEWGTLRVLSSIDLSLARSDQAQKKVFWGHLKILMQELLV